MLGRMQFMMNSYDISPEDNANKLISHPFFS